jgi:hypothetical protein
MKTINIKGKEYVTVNERLKEFRNNFKDYALTTDIIELGADYCTIKACVIDDKGIVRSTGFAREVIAKSPINKFAFVENCETSAIGRALGNFGIGIDEAVCTADELLMKLSQDKKDEPKPERTEFEKEASKEKAQHTRMMNKAVAAQDESLVKPVESKLSIDDRFKNAQVFLSQYTPATILNAKPSAFDSIRKLIVDLNEVERYEDADLIEARFNALVGVQDSIPY